MTNSKFVISRIIRLRDGVWNPQCRTKYLQVTAARKVKFLHEWQDNASSISQAFPVAKRVETRPSKAVYLFGSRTPGELSARSFRSCNVSDPHSSFPLSVFIDAKPLRGQLCIIFNRLTRELSRNSRLDGVTKSRVGRASFRFI